MNVSGANWIVWIVGTLFAVSFLLFLYGLLFPPRQQRFRQQRSEPEQQPINIPRPEVASVAIETPEARPRHHDADDTVVYGADALQTEMGLRTTVSANPWLEVEHGEINGQKTYLLEAVGSEGLASFTIGRNDPGENWFPAIRLNADNERSFSRQQGVLRRRPGNICTLENLSANIPIVINKSIRLHKNEEHCLQEGDHVTIGDVKLIFHEGL